MVEQMPKLKNQLNSQNKKNARMANTTQIAKLQKNISDTTFYIYLEPHSLVGPIVQNGSLF